MKKYAAILIVMQSFVLSDAGHKISPKAILNYFDSMPHNKN